MHPRARLLKYLKLIHVPPSEERAGGELVFKKRTAGMQHAAFNLYPFDINRALESYGYSCYTQGLMDGVQVAARNPEFTEEIKKDLAEL